MTMTTVAAADQVVGAVAVVEERSGSVRLEVLDDLGYEEDLVQSDCTGARRDVHVSASMHAAKSAFKGSPDGVAAEAWVRLIRFLCDTLISLLTDAGGWHPSLRRLRPK